MVTTLPREPWRRALLLGAVVASVLLLAFDLLVLRSTVVRLCALANFGGADHVSWPLLGHILASAASLPAWGKLWDVYGRRPLWLGALALFMLGAAVAGASQEIVQLSLARIVQGLGTGGLTVLGPTLIGDLFPPRERAKWQGALAALFGVAMAWVLFELYPLNLVGVDKFEVVRFLEGPLNWRWFFFGSLPVGGLAVFAAWFGLPTERSGARPTIGIVGACAVTGAMVLLLLALARSGTIFPWWSVQSVGLLIGAAAMLGVLVIIERRAADPMINLRLLKNRSYVITLVLMLLMGMTWTGHGSYIWPFYLNLDSSLFFGRALVPVTLAAVVSAMAAGQIMAHTGRSKALLLALFAVGAGGAVLLVRMSPSSTEVEWMLNMAITGLGIGGVATMLIVIAQNAVPDHNLGQATAGLFAFWWLGDFVGGRIEGLIALTELGPDLQSLSSRLPLPPLIAEWYGDQFVVIAFVMAAGFAIAALLPAIPLRARKENDIAGPDADASPPPSP